MPTPDFCIAEGSDVRVRSQCYFWGPVDAGSAAEALEIFRTSDLPLLQAALSIRFENPYRLELMWAERGRVREAASSANVSVIFWVAQEPNDEWIARANADYLSLEADERTQLATRDLGDAIAQKYVATSDREISASLLTFFHIIERMASIVPMPHDPDLEDRQRQAVESLRTLMDSSAKLDDRVTAVKKAAMELRRIEGEFLNLRITAMADVLQLGDDWRRATRDFLTYRNRRLSHPGRPPSRQENEPWHKEDSPTCAYKLAAQLLAAYAVHKSPSVQVPPPFVAPPSPPVGAKGVKLEWGPAGDLKIE